MARKNRVLVVAVVAALLLTLGLAAVVQAATPPDAQSQLTLPPLWQKVAQALGITEQAFKDAIMKVRIDLHNQAIDKSLADGRITEQQAQLLKDQFKARVDQGLIGPGGMGPGFGFGRGRGMMGGPGGWGMGFGTDKLAPALGVSEQQLKDAITQAQIDLHNEWIDKSLADGRITEEQAQKLREWYQARIDNGGFGPGMGPGFGGFGPGPGPGGPRGRGPMMRGGGPGKMGGGWGMGPGPWWR